MADLAFEFAGGGEIKTHAKPTALINQMRLPQHVQQTARAPTSSESQAEETEKLASEPPAVQAVPDDEHEERGKGDNTLYLYYLGATGRLLVLLWLFTVAAAAVAERMPRKLASFRHAIAQYPLISSPMQMFLFESGWIKRRIITPILLGLLFSVPPA